MAAVSLGSAHRDPRPLAGGGHPLVICSLRSSERLGQGSQRDVFLPWR